MSGFDYQVGGSLDSDAPSYVTRYADTVFYETLKAGRFCYVLNSRQMGKSSLRVRVMQRLQAEGIVCVFIDLTGMGTQDVTPEKWYAGIVQCLVSSCQIHHAIDWRAWWREHRDLLSPVQRLGLFIEEVVLVQVQRRIVIFVDEIDRVLSQSFSLDDFFGLIRCFAVQEKLGGRVTFALLGVATPSNLIQDKSRTPFNIGQAIELRGFQLDEAQRLTEGFIGKFEHPERVMREILHWTGGQPFLTQRLCRLVLLSYETKWRISPIPYSAAECVEQVVKSLIVENWEAQDDPEHLQTIQNRILRCDHRSGRLLEMYQRILHDREIVADSSPEQMELRLSGLVVERQGQLIAHNRIYQDVFNAAWVERKLAELRPYAQEIAAWSAVNGQDDQFLLRGQMLQNTLAWALGKSLGDADYQYIVASQEFAKRQAQSDLASATRASQILASARQEAKQEIRQQRLQWSWIPKVSFAVTLIAIGLQFSGLLQGLEWGLLDQFFRWRSLEVPDSRIAVITIDELDLKRIGQWPIPDRTLARALTLIKAQKPLAIGLDLYRDLPVEPGHRELKALFQTTPDLFGIEKLVQYQIAAAPTLSQHGQVGFSDQVVDGDGRVRRALLSMNPSDHEIRYSLALTLALRYLNAQNVVIKPLDDHRIRLGKAVIRRLEFNDGGYGRTEIGGYQILLNYRGTRKGFTTFSLHELLTQKIPSDVLQNRIVFLGSTAESLNDFFYTPYSKGLFSTPLRISGVMLQANVTSSLLSAALEERPLLTVWPKPMEAILILGWAGLGAGISLCIRSSIRLAAGAGVASAAVVSMGYGAFLLGWWGPSGAALLALLGSAAALRIIDVRLRDKMLFRCTLAKLLLSARDYPTEARIALEYFRQSEHRDDQTDFKEYDIYESAQPLLKAAPEL